MNIEFTLKNYRCFSDDKPARFCVQDGFIAFVGINNSGKSTILRFFYEFRPLFQRLGFPSGNFAAAITKRDQFEIPLGIRDPSEIFCDRNQRDIEIEVEFKDQDYPQEYDGYQVPDKLLIRIYRNTANWSITFFVHGRENNLQGSKITLPSSVLELDGNPLWNLEPVMAIFRSLTDSLYIGAFRNAINVGAQENYFDISTGEKVMAVWRSYKTGNIKRANNIALQVTEEIRRIFEFSSLDINASDDGKDFKLYVDGKSYTLSELGGGLAQFLIVLTNAAIRNPALILIDEPELSLHPRLQLDFLTTLGSYAKNGVLFATHSIGLARASAEFIYSIRVNSFGIREVVPYEQLPSLSEFLGELNFSGYRELGFSKLLLVEGTHDVTTIQQFLRKYNKDHEIVILPLGGSSLINDVSESQLEEIHRITDKIYALIDSEIEASDAPLPGDRQNFLSVCQKLQIECHVLKRRAIENYFSERAIQNIKGSKYSALQPYQHLKSAKNGWSKSENWRIAREMTKQELDNTDLGEFLDKI